MFDKEEKPNASKKETDGAAAFPVYAAGDAANDRFCGGCTGCANKSEAGTYCQEGAGVGKTVAAGTVGKTVAAVPGGAAPEADRGKTVGIIKKKIGIDPAVGFLVCVSGPHRGADYKLVAGRNFIGRAAAMDVALADDDTVSRESHALVTYDAKHNSFSLSPGQGRGITYCNDEQVEMVRPLKAYDVIEVGKSQLLFLPLCGEQFQWNEE